MEKVYRHNVKVLTQLCLLITELKITILKLDITYQAKLIKVLDEDGNKNVWFQYFTLFYALTLPEHLKCCHFIFFSIVQ